jgi:hypothetical protein
LNGCETCMDEIFMCMDVRLEWMRFLYVYGYETCTIYMCVLKTGVKLKIGTL